MPSVAIVGTRGYPSYYGGFETAVRLLAPYLADEGWDTTVYSRRGATRPDDDARDARVKVTYTRGINKRSLSTLTYGLTSMIHAARKKPDVVLIMNVANCVWLPLLRLRSVPTIVNVDGIEWEREKWGTIARAVFKFGAKITAKWADEIVVDAHTIGDRWREDYAREGVFIPYGGTPSSTLAVPEGVERRRYALLVARFVPENSIAAFIEAAKKIAVHHHVVMVGSSGYGGELEERVRDLNAEFDNVTWLGHISNDQLLHSLWQHAGAYFHGHTVGGTNPSLVQAMALGAPVVAVDTVYNREVLADTGVLTKPDGDSIHRAIVALLEDSAEQSRLSGAAMQRAAEEYSWRAINSRYEEQLRRLATISAGSVRSQ